MCEVTNSADYNYSLMRLIATDGVAWSLCLCIIMGISTAKTAEAIEMPFSSDGPT